MMKVTRRTAVFGAAAAGFCAMANTASAAEWPANTVKIVVPFPPGGSTDLVGRLLATYLNSKWKQTVIVENKPGGNGMLGPTAVAKSKPDGYTFLLAAPTIATAPATVKNMPITPMKDLEGVSQLIETDYIIAINSSIPAKTLKEFIALAKANPGKYNYGSYATGARLSTEYFKSLSGTDLTYVGYKGEALAIQALIANEVQVVIATSVTLKEPVLKGQVRALAISGPKRSSGLPNVPTTKEAGLPEFDQMVWFGMFAPAGTPADIKNKMSAAIAEFSKLPDTIAKLGAVGLTPKASTPKELSDYLAKETGIAVKTAKQAGIEPQ